MSERLTDDALAELDWLVARFVAGVGTNLRRQTIALACLGDAKKLIFAARSLIDEVRELRAKEAYFVCPTCKACGESGCCPPDQCKHLVCYYGKSYSKSYAEMESDVDRALAENARLQKLADRYKEGYQQHDAELASVHAENARLRAELAAMKGAADAT